jgi:hypothetical protein
VLFPLERVGLIFKENVGVFVDLEFLINKYGEEGEGSPEKGGVILESD